MIPKRLTVFLPVYDNYKFTTLSSLPFYDMKGKDFFDKELSLLLHLHLRSQVHPTSPWRIIFPMSNIHLSKWKMFTVEGKKTSFSYTFSLFPSFFLFLLFMFTLRQLVSIYVEKYFHFGACTTSPTTAESTR